MLAATGKTSAAPPVTEVLLAAPTLIGIDVGTTSVKAILVEANGTVLNSCRVLHPTQRPRPGHVEQDPRDWMRGVLAALTRFAAGFDLGGLRGIGICSQVNTHVFVDERGEALLPAIIWQDGRCAEDAAALDAQVTPAQKIGWFGAPIPIDASHGLSRMSHVARHHPEIWAKTRYVLLPKDYCTVALTGQFATDPISAIGLVDTQHRYVDDLLALVPGARQRLAPLGDFTDRVGVVKAGLPCAGTPVVVGAMDAWAGMFGLGVIHDGEAMYQSGTSEILGIVSATVVPTPGVIVFPAYQAITLHAAPTQAGGSALIWLGNLVNRGPDELLRLAREATATAATPLFLPHLEGERAPLWDSRSRGVFGRLDASTGPGDLALAVMEGVAFSVRLAFTALETSAGGVVETVNIGGGGARSDLWCQIRADVLGKTLQRAAVADAGTLGAVILAGLGVGEMVSLEDAIQRLVRFDRSFEPDTARRGYYDDRYGKYLALYADLRGFNDRFA